jgi:6-phosphofructokinase 1
MHKIALFTSGGDAPGMNACIRAIVRTALHHGMEVAGIRHGYEGMIGDEIIPLDARSVSNIIHRGGTVLKTARSAAFLTVEGRMKAVENLERNGIDGLIAIGGDGTFKGALALMEMCSIPVIGIPGTIDNDLFGTDICIGFDTAVNTVIEAVDKIRDTADSLDRLFLVEVMGRDAGLIALHSGISSGAEAILLPETPTNMDALITLLKSGWEREKSSKIIIVAEGDEAGGAMETARKIRERFSHYDIRVSILGHIQRGGNPSCVDRYHASWMGFAAVNALMEGHKGEMIGIVNHKVSFTPFEKAVKYVDGLSQETLDMLYVLAS